MQKIKNNSKQDNKRVKDREKECTNSFCSDRATFLCALSSNP